MTETAPPLPASAKWLGYAGLLPQVIAVAMILYDPTLEWIALAGGYGYAAFIFSFLGGVWWGLALNTANPPGWLYPVAVAPSLIALASYLPWIWGLEWPEPSLNILAVCLLLSPMVDSALGRHIPLPAGWMRLRVHLSTGLGLLTMVLAIA
ncbi:MAG TPA: DUF3429 domain-containing protein [Sphingorhabdus sp.]|jgi:hypothetical protein|uniref:DUF3429 domain-containing protein n=1 Tax=Sphingorhabdus sp. TaxID=1902408 RepID=UPI002BBF3172|nr:DUF3429 domain-containing protein [Sphingorhabdus sp.]HMT42512.1 DUF3429 domain-containing protein [Sphingorhabdus sp.]HMU23391.1 DUF3429 domain-containing protein [Sphingorhabdus sp.]